MIAKALGNEILVARVSNVDRDALRELLTEYFNQVLTRLTAVSGLEIDIGETVETAVSLTDGYLAPDAVFVTAICNGRLVGSIAIKRLRPDAGEIKNFYVRPELRGRGLGRQLLEATVDEARRLGLRLLLLDTAKFLEASRALYLKTGFIDIPRYPDNFNPPEFEPYLHFMELKL